MMGACAHSGRSRQVPVSSSSTSPSPTCGDKDVKIRVLRAGLCGTDLHLEQWDEWAAATVQVPMTLGHEFFGEVVEVGADVDHVAVGDRVSGEGHLVCGTCRNCRAGRRHLCINTVGVGVNRDGAFADYVVIPATNAWVQPADLDPDLGRALRPARQRDAHGPAVAGGRRGRRGDRGRADRRHGDRDRAARRGPPDLRHRPVGRAAGAGEGGRCRPRRRRVGRAARCATRRRELGMVEGFDIGLEMSGSPRGGRGHAGQHEPRRPGGAARPAQGPLRHRLGPGHHAHDHAARHLRARDVRDLVPHGLDARDLPVAARPRCRRWSTGRYAAEDWEAAFAETRSGQGGKVVLDWS